VSKEYDEMLEKVAGRLLFDLKLVSPMVAPELEYNARQLAKELASLETDTCRIAVVRKGPEFTQNPYFTDDLEAQGFVQEVKE
jgi:hypothetical protein